MIVFGWYVIAAGVLVAGYYTFNTLQHERFVERQYKSSIQSGWRREQRVWKSLKLEIAHAELTHYGQEM